MTDEIPIREKLRKTLATKGQHMNDGTEMTDPDTGEIIVDRSLEIARDTLVGDLRDAALDWIKALPKPWAQLSAEQQGDVIDAVTKRATTGAARAVEIVAASGRKTIGGTLESVTIKDGIKAVVKVPLTPDNVTFLALSAGSRIQIVEADLEPFDGERAPAKPDADQKALPLNGGGEDGARP